MGQTLSEPITDKHSGNGSNERMLFAFSCMQGWRLSMEDAHTTLLQLPGTESPIAFFAVFDGHGGARVAEYAGEHVHTHLPNRPEFERGDYGEALKLAFIQTDADMLQDPQLTGDPAGCTAVACIITSDQIVCANSGDSRCVLGVQSKAVALSEDHKPALPQERNRILAAGGFIEFDRVNGNLAPSRAFGDFEFKKNPSLPPEAQIVTVVPEIMSHPLTPEVDFVVLACDGIWDCMTNQDVVDFVHVRIAEGKDLQSICEEILDVCLAPKASIGTVGCDNMSIIIVGLPHGKSPEEWATHLKSTMNTTILKPQSSLISEIQ